MALTLELSPQKTQTKFNLRRWAELLSNPEVAKIEGRVETDRYGHVVMSPPPAPSHGSFQVEIGFLLRTLLPEGRAISECPISTADGVKAADVAWASPKPMEKLADHPCFIQAPEICIEISSASNTEPELREKMALYFDAGAREVWLCAKNAAMRFFASIADEPLTASRICPKFPQRVQLK